MTRRCVTCGKLLTGSVIEHYRAAHMSAIAQHGEDKIRRLPNIFAPPSCTEIAREMAVSEAQRKIESHKQVIKTATADNPQQRNRVRMITALISSGCDAQTYREGKVFKCDMCLQNKTSGKRLLSYKIRYTVCYACYNEVKKANPGKRGNKHVFINTPM